MNFCGEEDDGLSFVLFVAGVFGAGGAAVLGKVDAGDYLLVHVSPAQFRNAWQLRQKYNDKPDISFVDFTSMVVMQDLQITDVFSGDSHFRQVNLGFQLHP